MLLFVKGAFRISFFSITAVFVLLLSYFLGFSYLQGITGGDSLFHLSNVYWLNRFFPSLPYWYPLQNGGVVPVWGYPQLSYFIVIIINKISSLSLVNSYQLLGFLSVPLTSLGIYLFAWTRLKNQTVATIAAIFYPLMPLSWVWLFDWGFYGESVSYIFIFPTLIFYDIFLKSYIERKNSIFSRISFFLTIILLALSYLMHPNTFIVILVIALLWTGSTMLEGYKKSVIKVFEKTILPLCLVIVPSIFLLSFMLINMYPYSQAPIPDLNPFTLAKNDFLKAYPTPLDSLFGFTRISHVTNLAKYGERDIVIPFAVWIPAILGLILSFKFSKKVFALGLLALVPIVYFQWPIIAWFVMKYIPFFGYFNYRRSVLLFIRILIPILAAFGIWYTVKIIMQLPIVLIKNKKSSLLLTSGIISIFSIFIALFLIIYFANKPSSIWKKYEARYGPGVFDIRNPFSETEKIKNDDFNINQSISYLLDLNNWPRQKIIKELDMSASPFTDFILAYKDEKMLRVDVSPYLGEVIQIVPFKSDISQINLYAFQLNLLGPYWAFEQQALFSENTGNTINVNNLTKWFGIKYVFLNNQKDPIHKYKNDPDNWKIVDPASVWRFNNPTKMVSWTTKRPSILVIGSKKRTAFEPLFKAAVNGGLSYEDGWLVQGKENIDDYSLEELKKFDTLVLFGYSYKNRGSAYDMLDKYVKEGGNLFISTGWQYVDKDWELKETPDIFPVKDLIWSNSYNQKSSFKLEDNKIGSNINASKFSPLSWNGQPWGVSVSSQEIRNWAHVILSADGKPIIVEGKYGNGNIVWSGFDLINHISTYNFNREEIKLFNNLLLYLTPGSKEDEAVQTGKVEIIRDNPDKVEFVFNNSTSGISTLYWRENQFPNWKATLITPKGDKSDIKIYKGGPGFMLMRLPAVEKNEKLILEFDPGIKTIIGNTATLITLISLFLYVVLGGKIINPILARISNLKVITRLLPFKKINKSKEEEDY